MIRLVPILEHPFDLEKTDKSLYGEDGSLEVLSTKYLYHLTSLEIT